MSAASSAIARGPGPGADAIWRALAAVPDPEIPVISVVDLGIIRGVEWRDDEWVISVTPTYSGCPATEVIAGDIGRALAAAGVARFRIETRLAPAWTTDWIAADARQRLADYGIAPPGARAAASGQIDQTGQVNRIDISALHRYRREAASVPCPRCNSTRTRQQSRYGSTPCKAQYRCDDCLEPFDYFKPH
ncbi:MAG TPA: 1,2-phenylacetyl-CoA epoxidase subunit PaaD [Casimicrobiaceae bacterium]|nr:1,2-phenylacetyl-CoA epoxidase subunit PaaD [Casimicrobiaceae bacterium]